MADLFIHLAIAKRYNEKHSGEIMDTTRFYDGNVMPDIVSDKEASHYGKRSNGDLIKRNLEKVGLAKFLESNSLDNDFNRGVFLHLYTDWEFYNNFLCKEYMKAVSMSDFHADIIYSGFFHDNYISKTHSVSLDMTSIKDQVEKVIAIWQKKDFERWGNKTDFGKLLFSQAELDAFIERISSVDLETLAKQITDGKQG